MQEGNKKPKWGKPKLIVITRGDRQERVLMACKQEEGGPWAGPVKEGWRACTGDALCDRCNATSPS